MPSGTARQDGGEPTAELTAVQENAATHRQYQGFGKPVPAPDSAGDPELAVARSGRDPY